MPYCYHVSYRALPPRGGEVWGSTAVTWNEPLATFAAMDDLRHRIEDEYRYGRDKVVIIAVWPLIFEGGER